MRDGKYHQGKFHPRNPQKYKGDYNNIVYRSSWEVHFMRYCDRNDNIIEWGSEEIFIPYFDPTTKKLRRYFPDFIMKVKDNQGNHILNNPKKYCKVNIYIYIYITYSLTYKQKTYMYLLFTSM